MKKLIQILIVAPLIMGLTIDFRWEQPLQRMNGDPMVEGEIGFWNLECGFNETGPYDARQFVIVNEDMTRTFSADFPEGGYWCVMNVVDTTGLVSDYSQPPVFFSVSRCQTTNCLPMPPVQVEAVVRDN